MKVTVLEKSEGQEWSSSEVIAIINSGAEVEKMPKYPGKLVILNLPIRRTISETLGNSNFTSKMVDYHDRWK